MKFRKGEPRYRSIHMGLEFVRDNERLVCGSLDWWESCELAISFGWKPSFASAKSRSYMLTKYPLDVPAEDALSFSQAIARCLMMLLNKQKLGRKQMAAILLSSKEPARSLGATETAGMLFLILGTASDMAALVMPSVAARAWQARHRATALAGWMVWLATFVFATMAGIGFASTNIADVTMVRASRSTPAVTAAQGALADAMRSRDAECKGGVGRYCREREASVVDRRQALDAAMRQVEQTADPQTTAATKLVSWVTAGAISPNENDFGMLRLALLCLLPQLAGVLLMVGRGSK